MVRGVKAPFYEINKTNKMKLLNYFLLGIQLFAVVFAIQYLWENEPSSNIGMWFFWLIAGGINASGLINELRTLRE